MFRLVKHRHEMIVAAAETAGTLQLALVHQQYFRARPACRYGRTAPGRTGTKNQHICFINFLFFVHIALLTRVFCD